MRETLLAYHGEIHVTALAGMFCLLALWEDKAPLRVPGRSLKTRWLNNFGLWMISLIVAYAVLPAYGVGLALLSQDNGWGVFNVVNLPGWLEVGVAVVLLDFALWLQHVILHKVSWLWRLHSVHHNDHDFDVTTGLRFHPVEVIYTTAILSGAIVATGASPFAAFLYLLGLTLNEFFGHANIRLPHGFERRWRLVFVSPDYHRIHHSQEIAEQQSNFAAGIFSFWDRLFRTYHSQPKGGHLAMGVGLPEFAEPRFEHLYGMLVQPFVAARVPAAVEQARDTDR